MKLCIDAGHGGQDPGAVGVGGRKEKDAVLWFAHQLKSEMQRRGHTVIMTRADDSYLANKARAQLANSHKVDAFLSLHQNAGTSAATGIETLAATKASAQSVRLAEALARAVAAATGLALRRGNGIYRRNVTVLTQTAMPASLLELGFITNASDMAAVDEHQQAIVRAVADVYEAEFGRMPLRPRVGKHWVRVVDGRQGVVDLLAEQVVGDTITHVEFRLYPRALGAAGLRVIPAVQNSKNPSRWARRYNLLTAYDGLRGRYVVRCKAYDGHGQVSASNAFVYANV